MKKDKHLLRDKICSLGLIPDLNAWMLLLQSENIAFLACCVNQNKDTPCIYCF